MTLSNLGFRLDIEHRKGTDLGPYFGRVENANGTPADLSGAVFVGEIRKTAKGPLVGLLSLAVVDGPRGLFKLDMAKTVLALAKTGTGLRSAASRYLYEIRIVVGSRVIPFAYGDLWLGPEVIHANE